MKKLIIIAPLLLLAFFPRAASAAVLLQYDFTGSSGAPTVQSGATGSTIANDQAMPTFEFSSNGYATDPELRAGPQTGATSIATAVSGNSYTSITITPDPGKTMSLTSLTFKVARGGASTPRGWGIRSSVDSYAANVATADAVTQRPTWDDITVDLSAAEFQNLTSAVTFRFYIYAPSNANTIEADDITFNGTSVSSASTRVIRLFGIRLLGVRLR